MMVWKLAIRPATAISAEDVAADAVAEDGLEAEEQGLGGAADLERAGRDAGVEEERQEGGDDQGQDAEQDAFGHVALGGVGLLGGERQFLDREVEPDRERQAARTPASPWAATGRPRRQPTGAPRVDADVERPFERSKYGRAPM